MVASGFALQVGFKFGNHLPYAKEEGQRFAFLRLLNELAIGIVFLEFVVKRYHGVLINYHVDTCKMMKKTWKPTRRPKPGTRPPQAAAKVR